ncbi:MAG: DUF192 domain-containing protein [Rhizobacter sp.]|nr:DUF192 domain-containing protein [Bacteriovorax sp.]
MENKIYKLKGSNGEIVCNKMILATNTLSRMKGLMFSEELPDCDGFLIKPGNSIHTFFMRYPLDIVFFDKNFKIVKVLYNVNPWRMTRIYFSSRQVLEMKAGTLKKNLNQGDTLEAICIS